jgi:hypothetical protein
MPESFEDHYLDVLQNIEFSLAQVYRAHADMLDYDARNAIEALTRAYQAEARGRAITPPRLNPLAQEAYDLVKGMCEIRLGRSTFIDDNQQPIELAATPLTLDETVACLKRIRKSIDTWNRQGGQRGYFNFVDSFLP